MGKCKKCGRTRNLNAEGICTDCSISDIKKRTQEIKKRWWKELLVLAEKKNKNE